MLSLVLSDSLTLDDSLALVEALVLADVLALVEALVLAEVLALVEALVLADVLALVDALVLADVSLYINSAHGNNNDNLHKKCQNSYLTNRKIYDSYSKPEIKKDPARKSHRIRLFLIY